MSENNCEHSKKPLKVLEKASKFGRIAFKIAFVSNIISFIAFILIFLRLFSIYAVIV